MRIFIFTLLKLLLMEFGAPEGECMLLMSASPDTGSVFTHSSRADFIESGSAPIVAWLTVPIEAFLFFFDQMVDPSLGLVELICQFYTYCRRFATFFLFESGSDSIHEFVFALYFDCMPLRVRKAVASTFMLGSANTLILIVRANRRF